MKTIVFKEFKHLAAYAAVAFVGCIGYAIWGNFYSLPDFNQGNEYFNNGWVPGGALIIWIVPFVAFFFGFWQCHLENVTGRNSFMIQRAVPLSKIFWCKAAVGISLAVAVVLVPYIGQECWRIYSDRYPMPSHWDLPGMAQWIYAAAAAWMGGVLVAVRPARWWGTRLLVIPALLIVDEFPWWLSILALAVYATAAYGYFVSQGETSRANTFARIALGIVTGTAGVGLIVFLIAVSLNQAQDSQTSQSWDYSFANHQFICQNFKGGRQRSWNFLGGPQHVGQLPVNTDTQMLASLQEQNYYSSTGALFANDTCVSFYDTVDHVFKQYQVESGHLISVLDSNGFRSLSDRRPYAAFHKILWTQTNGYVVTPERAWVMDFEHQRIASTFTPPPGDKILNTLTGYVNPDGTTNEIVLALATTRQIVGVHANGSISEIWQPDFDYASLYEFESDDHRSVLWFGQANANNVPQTAVVIENGREVQSAQIATTSVDIDNPYSNITYVADPVALYGLTVALNQVKDSNSEREAHLSYMGVAALISCFALFLISRRLEWSMSTTLLWIAIGLLFGVAALVAAITLFEWPAKLICPSCSKRRLVTKINCQHCNSPWPKPASDGAEVFEDFGYAASSIDFQVERAKVSKKISQENLRLKGTVSAFGVLVAKESRILLLPATLSFLVGCGYLIVKFNSLYAGSWWQTQWPNESYTNWFLTFGIICALGIAGGQFWAETRSDASRSFTNHRPVRPAYRFAVKLISGLTAYVVVLATIFAIFYAYSVAPGHLPGPFPGQGFLFAVRDLSIAFMFWFAAAFAFVQNGKWYGVKVVPLLFCALVIIVVHNLQGWLAIWTAALTFYLIVGLAAHGAYTSNGELTLMPIVSKAAVVALFAVSASFLALSIETYVTSLNKDNSDSRSESLVFSSNDVPFEADRRQTWDVALANLAHWTLRPSRETFSFMQAGNVLDYVWYGDSTRNFIYCYSASTRKLVGIVDADGWVATDTVPKHIKPLEYVIMDFFQGDSGLVVSSKTAVYQLGSDVAGAKTIYRAAVGEEILSSYHPEDILSVITNKRCLVLYLADGERRTILDIPTSSIPGQHSDEDFQYSMVYPPGVGLHSGWTPFVKQYVADHYQVTPGQTYLLRHWDRRAGDSLYYNISSTGKITRDPSKDRHYGRWLQDTGYFGDLDYLTPLSFGVDGMSLVLAGVNWLAVFTGALWPTLFGFGAVLLMSRRLVWKNTTSALWLLASLFLGAYVVAAIVGVYTFPVLIRCANCRVKRLVSRESCEHCEARWPVEDWLTVDIFEQRGNSPEVERAGL